jgi:tetratricopeptide (TPR) repeat protein
MTYDELRRDANALATRHDVYWRYPELLELLEQNTGFDKAISLENDAHLAETWGSVVETLAFRKGLPQVALQVANRLYELQLEAQEASQKRLHKGVALQVTAEVYFWLKRFSLAKRYFQLALIEDTVKYKNKDTSMGSPAYKSLVRDLGVPSGDFEQLVEFALGYINEAGEALHPEEIYTAFLLSDARPKTRDVERGIFRINAQYARSLLAQASGETEKGKEREKGDALEHLVAYLLSCVDGFEIVGRKHHTKDYEIDILIRNTITRDAVLAGFGPYILVECKNWDKKSVGTEQVNHFLSKIQFHDGHCGIMVARDGISGRGQSDEDKQIDRQNANLTVLKAFHRNATIMMVLDVRDLEKIVGGESNLLSILVSEYERIRFDRSTR